MRLSTLIRFFFTRRGAPAPAAPVLVIASTAYIRRRSTVATYVRRTPTSTGWIRRTVAAEARL